MPFDLLPDVRVEVVSGKWTGDDFDRMTRDLEPMRRAPLWTDVGRMTHVPASSTVLHGRVGYREVYRHFSRLRLAARVPMTKRTTIDLLELKDIALLYELWVTSRWSRP